jgi:hypothetical protein
MLLAENDPLLKAEAPNLLREPKDHRLINACPTLVLNDRSALEVPLPRSFLPKDLRGVLLDRKVASLRMSALYPDQ